MPGEPPLDPDPLDPVLLPEPGDPLEPVSVDARGAARRVRELALGRLPSA